MFPRKNYIDKIRPLINDPLIKVLVGMRRTGKSTLLRLLQEELQKQGVSPERFLAVNFELLEFEELKDYRRLHAYLLDNIQDEKKYYIFLDEIQEVPNFEKAINSLNVGQNVDIYLTGSNSRLLSGELSTVLTGRFITIEVFPLSFREMADAHPQESSDSLLQRYLRLGGLPAVSRFADPYLQQSYLSDVYASIMFRDIVGRYKIRDTDLLNRFMGYIMQNIGQIFSASSITKFLKSEGRSLSRKTMYNYLDACKNAFLVYGVPRYDIKGKQILKTSEKYFISDLGLRSLYFDNETDIGQSLENIVFLELRRRGYQVTVGEQDRREVDFIITRGADRAYLQVCYLLASEETIQREFSVLWAIKDNYPKYVISMDKIQQSRDGIRHLNIIDFLLSTEDLI